MSYDLMRKWREERLLENAAARNGHATIHTSNCTRPTCPKSDSVNQPGHGVTLLPSVLHHILEEYNHLDRHAKEGPP